MTEEEQDRLIAEVISQNRALADTAWRLQGRINALELVNLQVVQDLVLR